MRGSVTTEGTEAIPRQMPEKGASVLPLAVRTGPLSCPLPSWLSLCRIHGCEPRCG